MKTIYRKLKTDEEETQYRKYCHYCFPGHTKGNNYKKFYWPHHALKREWMRGLFLKDDKTLLGGKHLIPMDMKLGGAKVRAFGLAGVAVPSQYRDQKVAFGLLKNMFVEGIKTGFDIACGFPFKYSFYDKIEATLVEEMKLLKFRPEDCQRQRTGYSMAEKEDDCKDIKFIYNEKVKEIDYICIRGDFEWQKKLEDSFKFVVYDKEKKPKGYILVKFIDKHSDLHRSIRTILKGDLVDRGLFIEECFWLDTKAKQEIFNFLYTHRDQRDTIIGYFPMWENIIDYMTNFHYVWNIKRAKTMIKIINLKSILRKLPYPEDLGDFKIVMDVTDRLLTWNDGCWTVKREKGVVKVSVDPKREKKEKWDVKLNIIELQGVVAGFMSFERLVIRNKIEIVKEKMELLDKVFPKKKNFFNESF